MRIFHRTDYHEACSILREGFAVSKVNDSQGCTWFWLREKEAQERGYGDTVISAEVPEKLVGEYKDPQLRGLKVCLPWLEVNKYKASFSIEKPSDAFRNLD